MSELDQLRQGHDFKHRPLETGSGSGILWAFGIIAAVFAIIFVLSLVNGPTGAEDPAATGATPAVTPEATAPVAVD